MSSLPARCSTTHTEWANRLIPRWRRLGQHVVAVTGSCTTSTTLTGPSKSLRSVIAPMRTGLDAGFRRSRLAVCSHERRHKRLQHARSSLSARCACGTADTVNPAQPNQVRLDYANRGMYGRTQGRHREFTGNNEQILLAVSRSELLLLAGSVGEAIEAVGDWEFSTRLGADKARRTTVAERPWSRHLGVAAS